MRQVDLTETGRRIHPAQLRELRETAAAVEQAVQMATTEMAGTLRITCGEANLTRGLQQS